MYYRTRLHRADFLFLKYLDGLEQDRADEAALESKSYTFILDKSYRWEQWPTDQPEGLRTRSMTV